MTRRVLFFGESATLAHVARPIVLAQAMRAHDYQVCVATGSDFRRHVDAAGLPACELWSIGTRAYLAAVAAGRPVFPYEVLERYVQEDLRAIDEFRPDVVVGDFRLSLAVSARVARVPYVAVSNAYWSPYADARLEVPVHAATRLLGVGISNAAFRVAWPAISALHSLPMHRLRRRYGQPSLGFDLRRVFTEGDVTVFADVPEMVPTVGAQPEGRYRYIGPITWSPDVQLPAALSQRDDTRPLVYVSLGSSGDEALLGAVLEAVLANGCRAAVAARATPSLARHGDRVVLSEMLPGAKVAAMASLVVCNGGSPSVHQALQAGVPVLGIPANLDQLLNMQFTVHVGAGLFVRADQLRVANLKSVVGRLLREAGFREASQLLRACFARYRAEEGFRRALVDSLKGPRL